MKRPTVGVIGGGAAGMMAAITASRQGATVTLLERNDRVGKKLLATGNGKCNLGNLELTKEHYYGGNISFIMDRLKEFGTEDTIAFFKGLGLMLKERNGYLYPACEQAAVVLDVLRMELKEAGIEVITRYKAAGIARQPGRGKFTVTDGSKEYEFDRVIIACGGMAAPATGSDGNGYRLAESLGHGLVKTVPALVQLRCKEDFWKAVGGVRADACVSVWRSGKPLAWERGELQFTEYGISGIPVFQLSRIAAYLLQEHKDVEVHINLLPDYDEKALEELYQCRCLLQGERNVEEFFTGMLNKKIMRLFCTLAGLKPAQPLKAADEKAVRKVFSLCRDFKVTVTATNPYENAQVCAGGIPLDEITGNMESRKESGVYFAGEILDVDGKCGGYNLQWAWTSGCLAGKHAGSAIEEKETSDRTGSDKNVSRTRTE